MGRDLSVNEWIGKVAAAADAKAAGKTPEGEKNWFVRPVVGPIPGGGVLAIGAGVLGLLGYLVKRAFYR